MKIVRPSSFSSSLKVDMKSQHWKCKGSCRDDKEGKLSSAAAVAAAKWDSGEDCRFDGTRRVALGGEMSQHVSSMKRSKEAIIDESKRERDRRRYERALPRAAILVQREWRACCVRRSLRQKFEQRWEETYTASTSGSNAIPPGRAVNVTPKDIISNLLPLCFAIHMPYYWLKSEGQGEDLKKGCHTLPIVKWNSGTSLSGTLSIVLRGLTSTSGMKLMDKDDSFVSDDEAYRYADEFVHVVKKLIVLCSSVLGALDTDVAVQGAAARVLELLSNPDTTWSDLLFSSGKGSAEIVGLQLYSQIVDFWSLYPMTAAAAIRLCTLDHGDQGSVYKMLDKDVHLKIYRASVTSCVSCQVMITLSASQRHGADEFSGADAVQHVVSLLSSINNCLDLIRPNVIKDICSNTSFFLIVSKGIGSYQSAQDCCTLLANYSMMLKRVLDNEECQGFHSEIHSVASIFFDCFYHIISDSARCDKSAKLSRNQCVGEVFVDSASILSMRSIVEFFQQHLSMHQFSFIYYHSIQMMRSTKYSALCNLAFNASFLSVVWKTLAIDSGLPIEIPREAASWHIPVARGIASLSEDSKMLFSVFCQVLIEYLRVAEDSEFVGEHFLSLAKVRAIAASCNTLIFRTFVPSTRDAGDMHSANVFNISVQSVPYHILQEHLGNVVRGLHERDMRLKFCNREMWLEPFKSSSEDDKKWLTTANSLMDQIQFHSETDTLEVSRCMLQILRLQPHCIPFERRIEMFRSLVRADKATCVFMITFCCIFMMMKCVLL